MHASSSEISLKMFINFDVVQVNASVKVKSVVCKMDSREESKTEKIELEIHRGDKILHSVSREWLKIAHIAEGLRITLAYLISLLHNLLLFFEKFQPVRPYYILHG